MYFQLLEKQTFIPIIIIIIINIIIIITIQIFPRPRVQSCTQLSRVYYTTGIPAGTF